MSHEPSTINHSSGKIAVAMSGGVDSSVAAAMLKEQGYDVIGVTARLWADGSRCCSDEDVLAAGRTADFLGIPHHVFDLHDVFGKKVVEYFVSEYVVGRTPSPCALCNRFVKFGALMDSARGLGAEYLATGHYARIIAGGDGLRHLLRGLDAAKDQSYFLFDLGQDQLRLALFPLGGMNKREVVKRAQELGLPVANRAESQDLCFAEPGRHHFLVEQMRPYARKEGKIVDLHGKTIGTHDGIHRFTIGQRRGLGIAAGRPLYVVRVDAATNTVVVGDEADAMAQEARVGGVRWMSGLVPAGPVRACTKIRYNHDASPSLIIPTGIDGARVEFEKPQFAITPGQIAVFYSGDELIGGGWIEA